MSSHPTRTFAKPAAREATPPGRGRGAILALGGIAAVAFVWAAVATWYILCRDEFAQTFLARQAEMRIVYEDRVGDLKNRLEREITAGLVERKGFGARVDAVAQRQAEIEARQIWLSGLADRVGGGLPASQAAAEASARAAPLPSFPSVERAATVEPVPSLLTKPTPLPVEPFDLRLRGRGEDAAIRAPDRLSAIEHSLRRVSDAAIASTDAVRRQARDRAQLVRHALAATRVPLPAVGPARETPAGGPFIPAPTGFDGAAFAPLAAEAEEVVQDLERIVSAARLLPLGRPLPGDAEQTSGFGYRLDPFTRSAALHSGIDFRVPHGAAIRATAAGRVSVAEPTGGYGNMVEIEHEAGVSTRYGHLSSIGVVAGQKVEAGQVVGRAGSTGRSTGTHLHYETRIDGDAVNPARFLEAGRLLAAMR